MTITKETFSYSRDQKPSVLDGEERGAVIVTLLEWLHLWLSGGFIDGEYIADAGILVGGSRHNEMDLVVWKVLCDEPTLPMHNIVGAFLDGYWAVRAVSESFDLAAYSGTLDTLPLNDRAYAATALALYSALCSPASRLTGAQQSMIRKRLLIARGKILSHNTLPYVLSSLNNLVGPERFRPIVDLPSYRGCRCDDGPTSSLVVERLVDGTDVIRVHDVALRERTLKVFYEIVDSRHLDLDVPPLVSTCILNGLLEDRFRGQADNVEYVNTKTKIATTLPYDDVGD